MEILQRRAKCYFNSSKSFKSKVKTTGKTPNAGNTKNYEIAVPLKYLSNFWKLLKYC